MLDVKKNCAAVIGRVILIGFCIQIVLGILWMCNAFAGLSGFGEGIVCVTQILILGGVLWYGMPDNTLGWKLFRVLAVESFPMVLQTLMRPDPRVWMAIVFLLGMGVCNRCGRRGHGALVSVLVGIMCIGVGAGIGYTAAPETDLLTLAADRMAWTTLYQDYRALDESVKEKVDYTAMADSTYEAGGIENVFVPEFLKHDTRENLEEVLRSLVRVAWKNHKKQIVKEIMWDGAGYLVPPFIVTMQLNQRAYDSRTGLNYRRFLQPNPVIGKYAMRYGNAWFAAAFVLGIVLMILFGMRSVSRNPAGYTAVTTGMVAVWYTFSTTGRMDYQNSIYILCLWLLWMTEGAVVGVGQERAGLEEAAGNDGCAEEK